MMKNNKWVFYRTRFLAAPKMAAAKEKPGIEKEPTSGFEPLTSFLPRMCSTG